MYWLTSIDILCSDGDSAAAQVMFYTSTHMEFIHDHADYGFTFPGPATFSWG